eukprot:TRINITY_DN386_c0_g1_i8.p2 TRINITY_DN386_c0_g1~~TRINITY_DN386_c0_g1_i8.p2  ORF type:complete len:149 (+),score=71.64 TRINITY_DN386_c0_g1_i8:26-472(+)
MPRSQKSQGTQGKDGKKRKAPVKLNYRPSGRDADGKKKPVKGAKNGAKARTMRFHPGTVALREIKQLQKGTQLLIQKAPFQRLVRDASLRIGNGELRFRATALEALQEASEQYLIGVFEGAVILQLHRKKKTLVQKDLHYTIRIRGDL